MKKYAMITGGTGGIGLAAAKMLGQSGFDIILNGRDGVKGKKAKSELEKLGIAVDLYVFDASEEEEIIDNYNRISEKYNKIDILINNVGGLGGRCKFEGMTTEFYYKVIALNLDSVFFNTRSSIPLLKNSDYPSIINVTSIAGWNGGGPGAGVYSTAKAGVTTMTRALAKELAIYGIRVNAVSPGTIDTAFHANTSRELLNSWKEGILQKRLGKPEEIASVIEFLTSEKASYITGEIIQINGGQAFM